MGKGTEVEKSSKLEQLLRESQCGKEGAGGTR